MRDNMILSPLGALYLVVAFLGSTVTNAQFTRSQDYSEFRNQDQTYTTYNQILGGWGMYNVTGIDRTSNTLLCAGEASCANVVRSGITARGVSCYAVLSCAWSKIYLNALSNSFFECWAWQGVAFSTMYGGNTYDLHAPFCGENSIIDSSGSYLDTITVNLDAYYAGYNLTIICRNNNTCNVNCNGNSCHNTFVICENNANCMVSCNESISIVCPTIVNDISEIDYGSIDYLENMPRLYDAVSKIFLLESECDNNNQSMLLDIYQADTSDKIIQSKNGHLCIRAYYAMWYPSVLVLNSTEGGYSITCHGYGDCYAVSSRFEVNDGNIVCSGYGTCEDATVYMLNWNHYNETNTSSLNGNIFMGGGESGLGPWNVYDANTVICGAGGWGCDWPEFYGVKNLYLLAGEANSLDGVWIYSNGRDINVHLMANNPDADTFEIYCNEGDICNIICYTHGACQSPTTVYCNGTCNIECNEAIGIECPIIYSNNPTMSPTVLPTTPTLYPSNLPSVAPSEVPSMLPARAPSNMPSNFPTEVPITRTTTDIIESNTEVNNCNNVASIENNNNNSCDCDDTLVIITSICIFWGLISSILAGYFYWKMKHNDKRMKMAIERMKLQSIDGLTMTKIPAISPDSPTSVSNNDGFDNNDINNASNMDNENNNNNNNDDNNNNNNRLVAPINTLGNHETGEHSATNENDIDEELYEYSGAAVATEGGSDMDDNNDNNNNIYINDNNDNNDNNDEIENSENMGGQRHDAYGQTAKGQTPKTPKGRGNLKTASPFIMSNDQNNNDDNNNNNNNENQA